jgi:hypothetical protein
MHWLLICFLFSCVSCAPKRVEVVSTPASVQCDPRTTERCYNVTEAFLAEHKAIMIENIRLKNEPCPK